MHTSIWPVTVNVEERLFPLQYGLCRLLDRLKNECFYGRNFTNYSTDMFISYIVTYIKWYNKKRIKMLAYLSHVDYGRCIKYSIILSNFLSALQPI